MPGEENFNLIRKLQGNNFAFNPELPPDFFPSHLSAKFSNGDLVVAGSSTEGGRIDRLRTLTLSGKLIEEADDYPPVIGAGESLLRIVKVVLDKEGKRLIVLIGRENEITAMAVYSSETRELQDYKNLSIPIFTEDDASALSHEAIFVPYLRYLLYQKASEILFYDLEGNLRKSLGFEEGCSAVAVVPEKLLVVASGERLMIFNLWRGRSEEFELMVNHFVGIPNIHTVKFLEKHNSKCVFSLANDASVYILGLSYRGRVSYVHEKYRIADFLHGRAEERFRNDLTVAQSPLHKYVLVRTWFPGLAEGHQTMHIHLYKMKINEHHRWQSSRYTAPFQVKVSDSCLPLVSTESAFQQIFRAIMGEMENLRVQQERIRARFFARESMVVRLIAPETDAIESNESKETDVIESKEAVESHTNKRTQSSAEMGYFRNPRAEINENGQAAKRVRSEVTIKTEEETQETIDTCQTRVPFKP